MVDELYQVLFISYCEMCCYAQFILLKMRGVNLN